MSAEQLPKPETFTPLSEVELIALGSLCIDATERIDLTASVKKHEQYLPNPNTVSNGIFVAGEVAMNSSNVYRQVGVAAIQDLATSGVVRNGATAQGDPHRRWGHRVFWNEGRDGKKISTGGRFILEASKEAVADGWVTADKIIGIHTRTPHGEIINIIQEPSLR